MSENLMDTELFQPYDEESETEAVQEDVKKYLTFISDGLVFGVDSSYVMEIITSHVITMLPMVPDFVKGIINLRGQIIPIIDIRMRMHKPMQEPNEKNCIIVLDIDTVSIGIFVDEVWQVADVNEENISPMPNNSAQELVSGMLSLQDGTTMLLLDCDQLILI